MIATELVTYNLIAIVLNCLHNEFLSLVDIHAQHLFSTGKLFIFNRLYYLVSASESISSSRSHVLYYMVFGFEQ